MADEKDIYFMKTKGFTHLIQKIPIRNSYFHSHFHLLEKVDVVSRGGHWYSWHKGLRVYNRGDNPPDVKRWQDVQGFRYAKDVE